MDFTQFHLSVYQVSVVTGVWAVIRNRSRTQQFIRASLRIHSRDSQKSKTWFWYITTVLKLFGKNQITSQKTIRFFKAFEIAWTDGSLILFLFFFQRNQTNTSLILQDFNNQNRWFFENSINGMTLV
jgi:hypothetical protein